MEQTITYGRENNCHSKSYVGHDRESLRCTLSHIGDTIAKVRLTEQA